MDDPSSSSLLTIAFPHDQWLVTHVDPAWKTKQLKLWLLSKCLTSNVHVPNLPRSRRPPSPITFAPDPRHRPISPITFASASTAPRQSSELHSSEDTDSHSAWDTPPATDDEGITPLFESRPRPRAHLYSPPSSHTLPPPSETDASFANAPAASFVPANQPTRRSSVKRNSFADSIGDLYTLIRFSTGQTLEDDFNVSWYNLYPYELLEIHRIGVVVSLPREISVYVKPYFEAKVMALRVVWQRPTARQAAQDPPKRKTRLEWRERWVVIQNDVFNLCRRLNDSSPSHQFPLSDLLALKGATQLEKTLSVAEEQRIICIKFRVGPEKERKGGSSMFPASASNTEPEPPSGFAPVKQPNSPGLYAYAFSGSSARKAKRPGKLKKSDTFSLGSSKTAVNETVDPRMPSSSRHPVGQTTPSFGASTSTVDAGSLSKTSSGSNLRLPRINTSGPSKTKLMRTSSTLRKAQESLKTAPSKQSSFRYDEGSTTPPFVYTPPDAPDNTFNASEIDRILTIGKVNELGSYEDDEEETFSNLSSPVFAAPPSPLYAPPSSLFYNVGSDDVHAKSGDIEEFGNDADVEGEADVDGEQWARDAETEESYRPADDDDDGGPFTNKAGPNPLHHIAGQELVSEAGEWVVLDMIDDDAFFSILRVLHRQSPLPPSSSFIDDQSTAMLDTPVETPISSIRDRASLYLDPRLEDSIWDDTASRKSSILTGSSSLPNSPSSTSNTHLHDTPRRARSQSPGRHPESLKFSFNSSSRRRSDSLRQGPSRTSRLAPVPYPEWRIDVAARACSAGLGSVGKAMEFVQKQRERPYLNPRQRPPRRPSVRKRVQRRSGRKQRRQLEPQVVFKDDGPPSLDYHFGVSDADDDIIASPLSQHPQSRREVGSEGDAEDDEGDGSQMDSSDVEWRGWQRDLKRQTVVRDQRRARKLTRPDSAGSHSSEQEQRVYNSSRHSEEQSFSNHPTFRQQSRIALEPTAQVVIVPPPLPPLPPAPSAAESDVISILAPPSPPPAVRSMTHAAQPSAPAPAPNITPVSAGISSPSSAGSRRHKSAVIPSSYNFSPTEPMSSATTAAASPATEPHHKPGNGNLSSPSGFPPVYGSWRSDMGVRLRVQEPLHRKRDGAAPMLPLSVMNPPSGRLAFRTLSTLPQPSASNTNTPLMGYEASPPPTVKISPPSIIAHSGTLPTNKLTHGPGISRRSSSVGLTPELKRKGSFTQQFLRKKDSIEGEREPRGGHFDRSLDASSSARHEVQRDRSREAEDMQHSPKGKAREDHSPKGKAREDHSPKGKAREDHSPKGKAREDHSPKGKAREEVPESSPISDAAKRQRPKLSLTTGSSPFSSTTSKLQSHEPPAHRTSNALHHTKSKSRDLPRMPATPATASSSRIEATHSHKASSSSKPKKKGLVSLGADKLLTGFEPALDFVGGR